MNIIDKLKNFLNPKVSIVFNADGTPEIQLDFDSKIEIEDEELNKRIDGLEKIKAELINASQAIDFIKKML